MSIWNWFKKTEIREDSPGPALSGGGWVNFATGLGSFQRDKTMQSAYLGSLKVPDSELSELYDGSDLAARIVEFEPQEMFRKGYNLVLPDPKEEYQSENSETADELEKYAANLHMNELMLKAMIFGRLYGGCVILVGANDGKDPSEPLNEDNILSIKYLSVMDRRFLYAGSYYGNPFEQNYGEVATYNVTSTFGEQNYWAIHESRVIRFDGAPVDIIKRRALAGWTLSILQRPYNVLRQFESTYQAAGNLLVDAAQGVYHIKGLIDQISSGNASVVQDRMALVDMMRSSSRALILDAEDESFERIATPFNGIPEMISLFMQRMSAAANIPQNLLFGRPVAGLNATGEAEFRAWYDRVSTKQTNDLAPLLLRMFKLIALAKDGPTGGKVPANGMEICFAPLWQLTETEQASIYMQMAQGDAMNVTNGVLFPEEVALSRFRGTQLSTSTEINVQERKDQLKSRFERIEKQNELAQSMNLLPDDAGTQVQQPIKGTPGEPDTVGIATQGPVAS